jgi:hypothetical protein
MMYLPNRFIGSLLLVVAYQFWKRKKGKTGWEFTDDPVLRKVYTHPTTSLLMYMTILVCYSGIGRI